MKTVRFILLLTIVAIAFPAFGRQYSFNFSTIDSTQIGNPILFQGSSLPVGCLVQVIRPAGPLHPPINSGTLRGMPSYGDVESTRFGIGDSLVNPGNFHVTLTGQSAFPQNLQTQTSLNSGMEFYFRVWSDVADTATAPFPDGAHYVDGGPYTVPEYSTSIQTIWCVHVHPTSAAPDWRVCDASHVPVMQLGGLVNNTLQCGSVAIGDSVLHTVTIRNTGSIDLCISNYTAIGDFYVDSFPAIVAPGSVTEVPIGFRPTIGGVRNGNFIFHNNSAEDEYSINLTGIGTPNPLPPITVTLADGRPVGNALFFGDVPMGNVLTHTLAITNTDSTTITLTNVHATGDFHYAMVSNQIPGGGQIFTEVTFIPTAAGTRSGSFGFTCNPSGITYSLELEGNGILVPVPAMDVSQDGYPLTDPLQFNPTTIGVPTTRTIRVTNVGTANLTLGYGSCTGDYSNSQTSTTILPSENFDIVLTFSPTEVGTRTGTFTLSHNISNQPLVIILQGQCNTIEQTGDPADPVISAFSLSSYPNPFNATTEIRYSISKSEKVDLRVFDLTGREIANLVNRMQNSGSYKCRFDGRSLASGTYFVRMKAGEVVKHQKLVLLK